MTLVRKLLPYSKYSSTVRVRVEDFVQRVRWSFVLIVDRCFGNKRSAVVDDDVLDEASDVGRARMA